MLSDNWLKAKYIDLRRSDVLLRELLGGRGANLKAVSSMVCGCKSVSP